MTDNQINVPLIGDSRITKYSSGNIKKSLSLARKISSSTADEDAHTSESSMLLKRIREGKFNFDDFIKQSELINGKFGSLGGVLKLIPGIGSLSDSQMIQAEERIEQSRVIITSMTLEERANPDLLISDPIRQRSLASECNYSESDISEFIDNFMRMRAMMQQMSMGKVVPFPAFGS